MSDYISLKKHQKRVVLLNGGEGALITMGQKLLEQTWSHIHKL